MDTGIWGYDGVFPGPTIEARVGRRVSLRLRNALSVPIVNHLHGGRTAPESDGYPTDLILPAGGFSQSHMHDPMARIAVGEREYNYANDQRAATLWYHDHRMELHSSAGAAQQRHSTSFTWRRRSLPPPAWRQRDVSSDLRSLLRCRWLVPVSGARPLVTRHAWGHGPIHGRRPGRCDPREWSALAEARGCEREIPFSHFERFERPALRVAVRSAAHRRGSLHSNRQRRRTASPRRSRIARLESPRPSDST